VSFQRLIAPLRRILWLLGKVQARLWVCETTDAIGESYCNVSRHLKILKGAKLVKVKERGPVC
jgi:DNA-binding transcriptional ArsR family regulator